MTTASPLGALLCAPPPDLSDAEAAALALHHFGVEGRLKRLASERDLNFHIATPGQGYVLKLANPAEPAEVTDFQTRALLHLEGKGLPVPRVIRSLAGETEVPLPQGRLRLLTYLEGMPLHLAPRSPAQRRAMGAMAARITRGLAGFVHPAADHVLQWDIRHAARLRPLLPDVPLVLRPLCEAVLDRFETAVLPELPACRWQVVHNDLNPHNVLVDPADPDRIAGVLDFGDMVRTPLVCDLAVAASYQIDPADAPGCLAEFTAAYDSILPLEPRELALVGDLTVARMLTTIAITASRAAQQPGNATYILRNFASARAGLEALARHRSEDVTSAIARACGRKTP